MANDDISRIEIEPAKNGYVIEVSMKPKEGVTEEDAIPYERRQSRFVVTTLDELKAKIGSIIDGGKTKSENDDLDDIQSVA